MIQEKRGWTALPPGCAVSRFSGRVVALFGVSLGKARHVRTCTCFVQLGLLSAITLAFSKLGEIYCPLEEAMALIRNSIVYP